MTGDEAIVDDGDLSVSARRVDTGARGLAPSRNRGQICDARAVAL